MSRRYTRDQINAEYISPDVFATTILHKDRHIKRRVGELADQLVGKVGARPLTLVCLGYGAEPLHTRLIQQKPINGLKYKTMMIRARGYNGITPIDLEHDMNAIRDLDHYNDTNFMLVDEVRHTGRTMAKMKQLFLNLFPKSHVWSLCLIDREDCVSSAYQQPLDFVGFRVFGPLDRRTNHQGRQGWLVGYGMDIDDYYRGEKSVWWTLVNPNLTEPANDSFQKPKDWELPQVLVGPSHQGDWLLDEWEKTKSFASR